MARWFVAALALAACAPAPSQPDRAELDARADDVQTTDSRPADDVPDVVDVALADAVDAADDAPSADACEFRLLYTDNDGDGFGGGGPIRFSCTDPIPPRGSLVGGDCNDADRNIYPGAPEHCDGVDSNCDGESNDRTPAPLERPESPRDDVHISCATAGARLGLWLIGDWGYHPRCAYRGLESVAPFRNVGSLICQVCRARNGGECACWTDPIGGGGRSVPCPYDG